MEVHHHSHVGHRAKWKEYLFQFFMLFLAVFCGFLAEYQLEHFIEKERAKDLAASLYEELKSDSVNLHRVLANREEKDEHLWYVYHYMKDSNLNQLPRDFYPRYVWSFFAVSYILFEPKDGMLEQLKNSGSLRYFKSIDLQKAIGDYSVATNNLRIRNERESLLTATLLRDFELRHMDFGWIDAVTEKGRLSVFNALKKYEPDTGIVPSSIRNLDEFDRDDACAMTLYYLQVLNGTRQNQMTQYRLTSERLMKLLRDRYRLN